MKIINTETNETVAEIMKNKFFSIVSTDRYGVTYTKNFTKWADGGVSMQCWTSKDTHIKTKHLK